MWKMKTEREIILPAKPHKRRERQAKRPGAWRGATSGAAEGKAPQFPQNAIRPKPAIRRRGGPLPLSGGVSSAAPSLALFGFDPERLHLVEVGAFRLTAVFREAMFDMGEAPLELGVGRAQRRLRIDVEMTGEIDRGEQQIADLLRQRLGRAAARSPPRPRRSPRAAWRAPRRTSFQSKPTLPAFSCSLSARVSAGRVSGTPAERAGRRLRGQPGRPAGLGAHAFLLGLDPPPRAP